MLTRTTVVQKTELLAVLRNFPFLHHTALRAYVWMTRRWSTFDTMLNLSSRYRAKEARHRRHCFLLREESDAARVGLA